MYKFKDIELKKLCREDLPTLLELKSESWESTHHVTIANTDDQNRWYESLDQDVHCPLNLMLVAYCNCKNPIGFTDHLEIKETKTCSSFGIFKITRIDWTNRSADAAWDVFKDHRGKKLGKSLVAAGAAFCFDVFNLHRLNCEILESNIASQKCAEHAGFKKEGLKRESVLKKGIYVNSGVYGLLANEFYDLHKD